MRPFPSSHSTAIRQSGGTRVQLGHSDLIHTRDPIPEATGRLLRGALRQDYDPSDPCFQCDLAPMWGK